MNYLINTNYHITCTYGDEEDVPNKLRSTTYFLPDERQREGTWKQKEDADREAHAKLYPCCPVDGHVVIAEQEYIRPQFPSSTLE